MRIRPVRVAAAVAGALLLLPMTGASPSVAAKRKSSYIDLKQVPKPKITGAEIIAGLEDLVSRFPLRNNLMPNNPPMAEFLAKEAKRNGFKTKIIEYDVASNPPRTVRVVQALKEGTTKPEEWIAFVGHYDTVPQTVHGAYDDGSGTNMMRFFGKAFKKIETNRTIALLWFDAEEDGLLASQRYAEEMKKEKQVMTAVLGFDMVGIGYPAPYCICIYHGANPQDLAAAPPIIEHVNFEFLKFPPGDGSPSVANKWPVGGPPHVCSCGPNIRNSDESNFAEQGYFTMRWAGMRTATDYPGYHQPWDTVPFMELVAGSRENLEAGTENTFLSAYYTAMLLDHI